MSQIIIQTTPQNKMIRSKFFKLKYIIIIAMLTILSGCGNCLKSGGMNEKIETSFFDSNYTDENGSHIFNTGITINSGFLSMKISNSNLDFCYGAVDTIDIPTNVNGIINDKITLYDGDVANISIAPFATVEVTADVCNNKDPRVFYWNSSNCINGHSEEIDDGMGGTITVDYPSEIGMVKQIMLPISKSDAYSGKQIIVVNPNIPWITTGKGYSSFDISKQSQEMFQDYNDEAIDEACDIFRALEDSACTTNDFGASACSNTYSNKACNLYSELCNASTQYVASFCGSLCNISISEDEPENEYSTSNNYEVISDNFDSCGYMSTLTAKGTAKQQTSESDYTTLDVAVESIPGVSIYDKNNNLVTDTSATIIFANNNTMKGINTSARLTRIANVYQDDYQISIDLGQFSQRSGGYQLQINHRCIGMQTPLQYRIGSEGDWIDINMEEGTANFGPNDLSLGKLYLKTSSPPDGSYETNTGGFDIEVTSKRTPIAFFSTFLNSLKNAMLKMMYGPIAETPSGNFYNLGINQNSTYGVNEQSAVGAIYSSLIRSFSNAIQTAILLSISMFGLLFFLGAIRNTQIEIMSRIFRFIVVFILLGEKSYIFFYKYVLIFFNEFSTKLLEIFTSATTSTIETSNPFTFIDTALNPFFHIDNWLRVVGIAFTGPFGFIVFFILLYIVKMLFTTMIQASLIYFISILMVAILTSVAPMFISMLLFNYTKRIFDGWIKIMLQFTAQPIILLTMLTILTQILNIIFLSILNFDLCPQCVLCVEFVPDMAGLCLLTAMVPTAYDTNSTFTTLLSSTFSGSSFMGLPFSLGAILSILIIVGAIEKFVSYSGTMSELLFGMVIQANLADKAKGIMDSASNIFGKGQQSEAQSANKAYHKHVDEHQKDLGNARAGLDVKEERKKRNK